MTLWYFQLKPVLGLCRYSGRLHLLLQVADGSVESFLLFSSYNYHWYLKQRMDFCEKDGPVSAVWDIMSDCRLHVFLKAGRYDCYDFKWVVNDSQGLTADDGAYVALVDNGKHINGHLLNVFIFP